MSERSTESLIAALSEDVRPVEPLKPPLRRASAWLLLVAAIGSVLILALGGAMTSGSWVESGAMLATALLAIYAAFALSVPGAAPWWRLAPLPPLLLWIGLSGAGCYANLLAMGEAGWGSGVHGYCFFFIAGGGTLVGLPLLWLLSRARPIDPLPVALLGGLGAAALAAFLLQFFHPFPVTVLDLAFHLLGGLLIVGAATLLRRRALRPA